MSKLLFKQKFSLKRRWRARQRARAASKVLPIRLKDRFRGVFAAAPPRVRPLLLKALRRVFRPSSRPSITQWQWLAAKRKPYQMPGDPRRQARLSSPHTVPGVLLQPQRKLKPQSVCAARATRKQVMFAISQAGKKGQNKPRFNNNSKVIC